MGAWMGVVIYRDIHKFTQRCSRRWEVLCHWGNSAPLLGTLHFVEKALYKTYLIGTSKFMVTKVKWNFSVAWQCFFLFIFSKWLRIPFNIMFISLLHSIVKPLAFHPFSLSVIALQIKYKLPERKAFNSWNQMYLSTTMRVIYHLLSTPSSFTFPQILPFLPSQKSLSTVLYITWCLLSLQLVILREHSYLR